MPRPQRCRRIGCFPDRWRFGPLDEEPGESVTLTLDEFETIELSCRGSVKIVARQIDTELDVSVRFTGEETHEIPQAVRDALLGGAPGEP